MAYVKVKGRCLGEKRELTKRYTDGAVAYLTCRHFRIDNVVDTEEESFRKDLEGDRVLAYSKSGSLPKDELATLMDGGPELLLSGDIAVEGDADTRFGILELFDVHEALTDVTKRSAQVI